jgi:hypothetical protein
MRPQIPCLLENLLKYRSWRACLCILFTCVGHSKDFFLLERLRDGIPCDPQTTSETVGVAQVSVPLGAIIRGFPPREQLHPFEQALVLLTIGPEAYERRLVQVDALRRSTLEVWPFSLPLHLHPSRIYRRIGSSNNWADAGKGADDRGVIGFGLEI